MTGYVRISIICGSLCGLAACAASDKPTPDMLVRDKASAIRIAEADCAGYCKPDGWAYWTAELHDGQWWMAFHAFPREGCPSFSDKVDARTGKAHDGGLCVATQ